EGRAAGENRGRARPDGVPAYTAGSGLHLRQGLFLPGSGREECVHVDGAEGKPGSDQGVRPSGIRRLAERISAYAIAAAAGAGRSVPYLGSRGRRAKAQGGNGAEARPVALDGPRPDDERVSPRLRG